MDCDFKSCSWHQPYLQIYGILQICFRTPKLFCRAGDAKKYDLAHQCDSVGSSGWRNIDTGRFIHQNGRSGSNTYPVRSRYFCKFETGFVRQQFRPSFFLSHPGIGDRFFVYRRWFLLFRQFLPKTHTISAFQFGTEALPACNTEDSAHHDPHLLVHIDDQVYLVQASMVCDPKLF